MGIGSGEQSGGHEGEGREGGEAVVLLTAGEGKEAQDDDGPEDKGEGGFVLACGGCSAVAEGPDVAG